MKPENWPRYVTGKRLRSGVVAYYWSPQIRDIRRDCLIDAEALGNDFGLAIERANVLNAHLDAWREGRSGVMPETERERFGTVSWLFHRYVTSPVYETKVGERSRYEYRRAMERIEDVPTKTGGTVGELPVASITPAAVDKIYAKIRVGPRGPRVRQANLSIGIAARAWDVVRRACPAAVPAENPWRGVEKAGGRKTKPAATRAEAYALARALREIGDPHLGAAVLICFEWHQRPEHVRGGDITWADWRPPHRPGEVYVRHPKTGEKGWLPLEDEGGLFYPELEAYLAALPKRGTPIVLTAARRGPARPYSNEYAQRKVREARERANLGEHVTMDSCRHGGMTELGDSGATEAEVMASSMHKTPQASRLYVKRTETQRINAARKRREWVEGQQRLVKVGIGRQSKSRNEPQCSKKPL